MATPSATPGVGRVAVSGSDGDREGAEDTPDNDAQYYHKRILALIIGLETLSESLATTCFGCYVFHRFVAEIGIENLRQCNPVVYMSTILFLSGKATERVHTLNTCVTAGYDLCEMLGKDRPKREAVSE
jgi:hypothetical protein